MSPRSLGASAFLHAILALLVIFGLPHMLDNEDILYQPQVISVDLKIAPVANAPNRTPNPPKKPKPEPPKPAPKVEKEKVKKPEPKKPEPKPEPKPQPKPEPVKKEVPKKEEVKKEKPKEKPKKEEPKKDEPSMDDILKSIEKEANKEKPVEEKAEKGETIKSDTPYDKSQPLSQTMQDSIRNQIMKCWNYQGGAKDQENLIAHIRVVFREDGSISDAQLSPKDAARMASDPAFRSLVYSAQAATRNPECVPLKGLPRESYGSWKEVELVFNPADWM